ncbi:MFS transporter [Bacillus sp. RG28]|uniref:MFS transporter n=1 Tax=Gottfriedia endophytica TaxID=2820819 RepID=A0A940SGP4_9BACI|nr:MFS transporter [Gottfriedia endophytica]MBP0725297.1 MFS transporter [Gottfriedia endophytica]
MTTLKIPVSIKILLTAVLFMNTGSFMIMPFLAIYLSENLHFSSLEIGTVLTTILISQRGLPLITGFIGDHGSHTVHIVLGVIIRGLGFCLFIVAKKFEFVVFSAFFIGLVGALFDPSVTAFFASQEENVRKKTFTYFNQVLNTGVIIGPLIGASLVKLGPIYPFSIAGISMLVLACAVYMYRNQYPATIKDNKKILDSVKYTFSNKHFLAFISVMILFWIMFAQLNISFPLKAYALTKNKELVSSIFIANGITGLLFMFFLRGLFIKLNPIIMVKIGVLIMGFAIAMIPIIPSIYWVLCCVCLYTLGETMVLPAGEMAVAQFSTNKPAGLFFGMFQTSWALGGSIGNYFGAWLSKFHYAVWPWLIYFVIGVIAFVIFHSIQKKMEAENETLQIQSHQKLWENQ